MQPSHDKITCGSKQDESELYCDSFLTMLLSFIVLGRKNENACKGAPKTCSLLDKFPETTGCRRGQVPRVFSVLGRAQLLIGNKGMWMITKKYLCPLAQRMPLLMKQFHVADVRIEGENVQCIYSFVQKGSTYF